MWTSLGGSYSAHTVSSGRWTQEKAARGRSGQLWIGGPSGACGTSSGAVTWLPFIHQTLNASYDLVTWEYKGEHSISLVLRYLLFTFERFFFFFNIFYCCSSTVFCLFPPPLHTTPALPTFLPCFHPPPCCCPCVLYNCSCKPFTLFPWNPLPSPLWSLSACSQFQCLWNTNPKEPMHPYVYSYKIYNSQVLEAT